jgi:hypothetical protein
LNHKHNIPSPYKGESGIVLEDQENEAIVPEVQEADAKVEEVKTEG